MATVGGLVAFAFGRSLDRLNEPIVVLDAAGLSLFAVTGALKALDHDMGLAQAVILGTITAVGGGTVRDVLIREVPAVLTSGLYAIPAGRDVHVTCPLGATALLALEPQQWAGTLVAVFQPAEEAADGARAVLDDDLTTLVGDVDVALAQHVLPYPAGFVGTRPGRTRPHARARRQRAGRGCC